ncbi:MAG TPA: response regulator transcription factor [Ktedonobacterales bacterium]|nr:response regulator transcription factor [Ktedonobacterales bacterium]
MRVYVVSTYPTIRAGLSTLVRAQQGWIVIGEMAPDAILRASGAGPINSREDPPDVVLADLDRAEDTDAIDTWLGALRPQRGIVVLGPSQPSTPDTRRNQASQRFLGSMARIVADQGLGFGALQRDATGEEIIAAISAVAGGLITLDRRLAGDLLSAPERIQPPTPERLADTEDALTARELEVLQLLAEGLPNKLIATRLHISEHTAKFHVSAIMLKLGAASRTEAVTLAARRGMLIL